MRVRWLVALATLGLVLVLGAQHAAAGIFLGNPKLGFRVDRPEGDFTTGSVRLERVDVLYLDGSGLASIPLGVVVNPVAGYSVDIPEGDIGEVTWVFDSDMDIRGSGTAGAFRLEVTDDSITADVSSSSSATDPLADWSVVAGSMPGNGPEVVTTID